MKKSNSHSGLSAQIKTLMDSHQLDHAAKSMLHAFVTYVRGLGSI